MSSYSGQVAKAGGFLSCGDVFYKETKGYLIRFFQDSKFLYLEVNTGREIMETDAVLHDMIDMLYESGRISECTIHYSAVRLSVELEVNPVEWTVGVIEEFIDCLMRDGVDGISRCMICERPLDAEEGVIFRDEKLILKIHSKCYQRIVAGHDKGAKARIERKRKALVGAILGGVSDCGIGSRS